MQNPVRQAIARTLRNARAIKGKNPLQGTFPGKVTARAVIRTRNRIAQATASHALARAGIMWPIETR